MTPLERWRQAAASAENQIKLGRSMQTRGMLLLNSIQPEKGETRIDLETHDPASLAKLLDSATRAIEKGAKLERESLALLQRLAVSKPQG